jgi:hypothetical protein
LGLCSSFVSYGDAAGSCGPGATGGAGAIDFLQQVFEQRFFFHNA